MRNESPGKFVDNLKNYFYDNEDGGPILYEEGTFSLGGKLNHPYSI
jgi:hypothetical protein